MQAFRNPRRGPDALTRAAFAWLAAGLVLLGLTPLPAHDASHGWSLAFWLLAAPAVLLLALHPGVFLQPARMLMRSTRVRCVNR